MWKLIGILPLVACLGCSSPDVEATTPRVVPSAAPTSVPRIDAITLPTWPPVGREGVVRVRASDDQGLTLVRASFSREVSRSLTGKTSVDIAFRGEELGEGFGPLRVFVTNVSARRLEARVENLLVDLTPPEVQVEKKVVARDTGDVAFVVKDAWVLGSVEVEYEGVVQRTELPKVYPKTLGTAWDVTRVAFPARTFPEAKGRVAVRALDAAGNGLVQSFALEVDGTPPTVGIVAPADGSEVVEPFELALSSSDAGGGPTTIEVAVGGAPAAVLVGPAARLRVDTATLPRGPLVVEAVAIDEAGNRSTPARLSVVVR